MSEKPLEGIMTRAANTDEAIALGLVLAKVSELDPTVGGTLEKAVGHMSKVIAKEAYLAGVRDGQALHASQKQSGGFRLFNRRK